MGGCMAGAVQLGYAWNSKMYIVIILGIIKYDGDHACDWSWAEFLIDLILICDFGCVLL